MATKFRGVVGGVEYSDPTLFEKAAKALGYRRNGRTAKWKVGTPVQVVLEDGTKVQGQVWSQDMVRNYAWLALDDGRYARVYMPDPASVQITNGLGHIVGSERVAA